MLKTDNYLRNWIYLAGILMLLSACATVKQPGQRGFKQEGKASYYAARFEGRKMANGKPYRGRKKTAAHRTMPFGTVVKVTNLVNGKSVKVVVSDRGPFVKGRIIDVSDKAARKLNMKKAGVVPVKLKVVKPAAN